MFKKLKRIFLAFEKLEKKLTKTRIKKISKSKKFKAISLSIIIVLVLFSIYFFGVIKLPCNSDECFNNKIKSCSPSTYTSIKNNNVYSYEIHRSLLNKCKVEIKLEKTAPGTDKETIKSIEGKKMICKIPKTTIKNMGFKELTQSMEYCTGELKEGLYEIMLKKMYGLVVTNMADIVKEVQKTIPSTY